MHLVLLINASLFPTSKTEDTLTETILQHSEQQSEYEWSQSVPHRRSGLQIAGKL